MERTFWGHGINFADLAQDTNTSLIIAAHKEDLATPTQLLAMPTTSHTSVTTPTQSQATPTTPGSTQASQWGTDQNNIVIKRGRGAAKTLNLEKLQMPLTQG